MPLPPTGYAEVTLTYTNGGGSDEAVNVFGVENVSPLSAEQICLNVIQDWEESLAFMVCDYWSLTSVRAVTAGGLFHEEVTASEGELEEPVAPPNVAYLLRKRTELVGRENQGRLYLPGVPQDNIGGTGLLEETFYATVLGYAEIFRGKLIADDIPMVILHGDDTPGTEVTAFNLDQKVATQRRRLR